MARSRRIIESHTMSTVFYRKWRPAKFRDVVGQQHITDTLRRAVMTDRVAHAYMFTGPRGVGKTSTARILAKALNSEVDDTGDPIPDAPASIAIDEGSYIDLVEIDAASNRGIDDIRALRDRVLLRPALGSFKVYIIDEVHMLTDAAFNALLKTLEEPPPQVVMVLATTDIHRVPATIISRCQRFDFRRLTNQDVIERLQLICGAEDISADDETLNLIASVAWGSLRDAENLLEQLSVSFGGAGSAITVDQARELLGIGDATAAAELATAILKQDAKAALETVENESAKGGELKGLRDGVVEILRKALLHKHGVSSMTGEIETAAAIAEATAEAAPFGIMHAISSLAQQSRFADTSSPLALEVAVLQAVAPPPPVTQAAPATTAASGAPARGRAAPAGVSAPPPSSRAATAPPAATPAAPAAAGSDAQWERLLEELDKSGSQSITRVLASVQPHGPVDNVLMLRPKYNSTATDLRVLFSDETKRGVLKQAFSAIYGPNVQPKLGNVLSQGEANSGGGDGGASAGSSTATGSASTSSAPPSATSPAAATAQASSQAQSADTTPTEAEPTNGAPATSADESPAVQDVDDPTVQMFRNLGGQVTSVEPN